MEGSVQGSTSHKVRVTDAQIDRMLDEMARVFIDYGANLARLNPTDMRLVAIRLTRAALSEVLSDV